MHHSKWVLGALRRTWPSHGPLSIWIWIGWMLMSIMITLLTITPLLLLTKLLVTHGLRPSRTINLTLCSWLATPQQLSLHRWVSLRMPLQLTHTLKFAALSSLLIPSLWICPSMMTALWFSNSICSSIRVAFKSAVKCTLWSKSLMQTLTPSFTTPPWTTQRFPNTSKLITKSKPSLELMNRLVVTLSKSHTARLT